jgi:two-component system response regulator
MSDEIKILIVEDNPHDEELIKREIAKAGIDFISICVETKEAYLDSLAGFKPDIVLSDYMLPHFNGMTALKLTLEFAPHLPFIIVTGSMNEETAVECMKAGASDYVIKGHMGSIGPAINGALELKRLKIENEMAEKSLRENEEQYRTLFETMDQGVIYFDQREVVTSANPAAERIMGIPLERMPGRSYSDLFGNAILENGTGISDNMHPDMAALSTGGSDSNVIMGVFNQSLNQYCWLRVSAVSQHRNGGEKPGRFYITLADITELKIGQDKLRDSLREKDILIKEIHHRVKNNMQIITSMLNLQISYNKNSQLRHIITDMQNRIKSMAVIHEGLYRTNDFSDIDLSWGLQKLSNDLLYTYEIDPTRIKLKFDIGALRLGIDASLPFSLIINELVSNSLKHAFPNGREGEICISLRKNADNIFTLDVKDNGIGLPDEIDMENINSMGLFLVKMLIKQIGGTMIVRRGAGTEYVIQFKE